MTADAAEAATLGQGLLTYLAAQLPAARDLAISDLSRSGVGSSRENWLFDATWRDDSGPVRRKLILRRDPPRSVVETEREREFSLLKALENTPIPTPRVFWADLAGQWLERPFMILERCPGTADRAILTSRNPLGLSDTQRTDLTHGYCDMLAAIHALDIDTMGLPPGFDLSGTHPAAFELALWDGEVRRFETEPHPALRLAAWWLHDHLPPPPARKVLVHGDFRPANALVTGGRIEVMLDWELAHVGDPVEDLGWYCTPLYRREHFLKGHWEQADFIRRYEARTGNRVDPAALRFWSVFAIYKLTSMLLAGISAFCAGEADWVAGTPEEFIATLTGAIETA